MDTHQTDSQEVVLQRLESSIQNALHRLIDGGRIGVTHRESAEGFRQRIVSLRDKLNKRRAKHGKAQMPADAKSDFDLLAWNADATRMPARMHGEYLRECYVENRLARGTMRLLGRRIRLDLVDADVYYVSAQDDHITPWTSGYASSRRYAVRKASTTTAASPFPRTSRSRNGWRARRSRAIARLAGD